MSSVRPRCVIAALDWRASAWQPWSVYATGSSNDLRAADTGRHFHAGSNPRAARSGRGSARARGRREEAWMRRDCGTDRQVRRSRRGAFAQVADMGCRAPMCVCVRACVRVLLPLWPSGEGRRPAAVAGVGSSDGGRGGQAGRCQRLPAPTPAPTPRPADDAKTTSCVSRGCD